MAGNGSTWEATESTTNATPRQDAIVAGDGTLVSSLAIRSGDLLWVMHTEERASAAATSAANAAPPASNVQAPSSSGSSSKAQQQDTEAGAGGARPARDTEITDAGAAPAANDVSTADDAAGEAAELRRHLQELEGQQQGGAFPKAQLPAHLERVLAANGAAASGAGAGAGLLLCAVHAAMLETGFAPLGGADAGQVRVRTGGLALVCVG